MDNDETTIGEMFPQRRNADLQIPLTKAERNCSTRPQARIPPLRRV